MKSSVPSIYIVVLALTYTLSPFVFDDMMVTAALVVVLGSAGKLMTSPGRTVYLLKQ